MSWQDHVDEIDAKYPSDSDFEEQAFQNWKEEFLDIFDDDERPQKEKELEDKHIRDLDDVWNHYENASGAFRDEDEFKEAYMPISSSYGGINFSVTEKKQYDLDREKDKWLDEMSEKHKDNFRRAQWNKNKNSIYWYDKDGNKHRASTHLANTVNGENVYDWIVKSGDYNDIPYKVEDVVNGKSDLEMGKIGNLQSKAHSLLSHNGSNQNETPAHIIPYSEVGNYADSFDGDEEREEDKRNSDELTKRDIKTFK